MQPKCLRLLPTIETINSQAKISRLLSKVDFTIDSSLLRHQLSQYIDSSMYRYTPTCSTVLCSTVRMS